MTVSRRGLLGRAAALAALPLVSHRALAAITREQPDLVLKNGLVLTVNDRQPSAEAIAIAGEHIVAVGSNDEVGSIAGRATKAVDLGGRTVVPGFIDAHCHPAYAGRLHLRLIDCDLRSIKAIQDAVRERAAKTPPGEWIGGFKYDDTKTAERRFLTREDLDAAAPGHPVYISHRGGHTGYANSLALAKSGITEQTPDPTGGKYVHDLATGRLTGRLLERAADQFEASVPPFNVTSRDDDRAAVKLITQMFAKAGVTSSTDAFGTPDDLRAYQDAREAGELSARIYCMIGYQHIDKMIASGVRTGFGDDWVRVGGMKQTCDGSISERTARLSESYVGRPNDFGMIVADADELYRYARKAHEAGWQLGTHANGDVGIAMVCDLYERLQRETAAARRALPHRALHRRERLARGAHEGARRDPDAVRELRVLPRREDAGVRRGAAEPHVRAPQLHRRRHPPDDGLRLPAGAVRADDGAAVHGHAHRHRRPRLGAEAEDHGRGGAPGLHAERRLRLVGRAPEGLARARQARGPRRARPQPAHRRPVDARHDPRRAHDGRRPLGLRDLI